MKCAAHQSRLALQIAFELQLRAKPLSDRPHEAGALRGEGGTTFSSGLGAAIRSRLGRSSRAGTPATTAPDRTFFSTTAFAPTAAKSPTVIGPRIFAPAPIRT